MLDQNIMFKILQDRSTFASQITNGLAVPKNVNNGTIEKGKSV